MEKKIEIDLDEARRVFDLLEKMNSLFHQPMKYKDAKAVDAFAEGNYDEIKELYYNVVWEWLPDDVKVEIEEG